MAYDELYECYLESDDVAEPPVPRIAAYVEALLARYPDAIDDNVVWAFPPVIEEASGPVVYLLMSYGEAEGDVRGEGASRWLDHCEDQGEARLWILSVPVVLPPSAEPLAARGP